MMKRQFGSLLKIFYFLIKCSKKRSIIQLTVDKMDLLCPNVLFIVFEAFNPILEEWNNKGFRLFYLIQPGSNV